MQGWLVIVLNRHCNALHQVTTDEFTSLGQLLLGFVSQALHTIPKTEKEYVIQLAEGKGFHHVHFHVIAASQTYISDWDSSVFNGLVAN